MKAGIAIKDRGRAPNVPFHGKTFPQTETGRASKGSCLFEATQTFQGSCTSQEAVTIPLQATMWAAGLVGSSRCFATATHRSYRIFAQRKFLEVDEKE